MIFSSVNADGVVARYATASICVAGIVFMSTYFGRYRYSEEGGEWQGEASRPRRSTNVGLFHAHVPPPPRHSCCSVSVQEGSSRSAVLRRLICHSSPIAPA